MTNQPIKAFAIGATLVLATSGVWAQATAPATTVGVTPQNAKEATQKAVPQADTATLVRTEPSAAEQVKDATKEPATAGKPDKVVKPRTAAANTAADSGSKPASGQTTQLNSQPASSDTGASAADNSTANPMATRPAKADRN